MELVIPSAFGGQYCHFGARDFFDLGYARNLAGLAAQTPVLLTKRVRQSRSSKVVD